MQRQFQPLIDARQAFAMLVSAGMVPPTIEGTGQTRCACCHQVVPDLASDASRHLARCPWRVLVAALRGEAVTA